MKLQLTEREAKDIQMALYYVQYLNHGATNHHLFHVLAKLATAIGIDLEFYAEGLSRGKNPFVFESFEIVDNEGKVIKKII